MMGRMRSFLAIVILSLPALLPAQWSRVSVPSTANLLAVHASGEAVWISGANGTVLRSADRGSTWTKCSVPNGTADTDLRSIQGIDATSAIAMTSGKGKRSRLFRTTDSCKSWTVVFTNPDDTGTFDSLRRVTSRQLYLLGEPADGKFAMYLSKDAGATWFVTDDPGLDADKGETAAGSTMTSQGVFLYFGTGGSSQPNVRYTYAKCNPANLDEGCVIAWGRSIVGNARGTVRAVAVQSQTSMSGKANNELVAVGSLEPAATPFAASSRGDAPWRPAITAPTAQDVAIAFDVATQVWIAAGAGGTDLSTDGGRHWTHAVEKATPTMPDAGWSAISLPFAVGADGAVGRLDLAAAKH